MQKGITIFISSLLFAALAQAQTVIDAKGTKRVIDETKDAWVDDNPNAMVKLGTQSNGTSARIAGTDVVIKDNGRVGIGTTTPQAALHVYNGDFRLENQNNWNAYKGVTYSNTQYPQLFLLQARGTKASPTYPQTGTTMGVFKSANAIDSTGGAGFRVRSTENQSVSAHGSSTIIYTTPNGQNGNIDRFIVDHNGNVGIAEDVGLITPRSRLYLDGYARLGTADATADALVTASDRAGMIRYNTNQSLQYHNSTEWVSVPRNTSGDIKQSLVTADHDGWIKMDGRAISTLTVTQQAKASSLGFTTNLPNAANTYLVQNGSTLGSISGSNTKVIARNQLPNVTLTASGTTSTTGAHTHGYVDRGNTQFVTGTGTGNPIADDTSASYTTTSAGDHSHTVTANTESLNGGVTQAALDVTPRSLSVNTFVYLGF